MGMSPKAEIQLRYVLEAMERLGFSAYVLGPEEALSHRTAQIVAQGPFPAILSNVDLLDLGVSNFSMLRIRDTDVAILGAVFPRRNLPAGSPLFYLQPLVDYLRPFVDVVLVVVHGSRAEVKKLVQQMRGVDIFLSSVGRTATAPRRVRGAFILNATALWIGRATFVVDGNGVRLKRWWPARMGKKVKEDPEIAELVARYRSEVKSIKRTTCRARPLEENRERYRQWLQETSPEEFIRLLRQGRGLPLTP